MNNKIHEDKNMVVYDQGGILLVEHDNHDNTCYLYINTKNEIEGFSATLDLHQDIIDWVNNHNVFQFGEELEEYKHN